MTSFQQKPGKLKTKHSLLINLDAMKPGAVNPILARKRGATLPPSFKSHKPFTHSEFKQEPPQMEPISQPKLHQITITRRRRRKAKRKSKKWILDHSKTRFDQRTLDFRNKMHPFNKIKSPPTPPPPVPPPLPANITPSFTPFDPINNKIDTQSPKPPTCPTPPPPPPPGTNDIYEHIEGRRISKFVDIKKTPQPPKTEMFAMIDKPPRDTASSTTFTVSGQKITIIGHARTGKTSLKNALFGREFEAMTFPTVKAPPHPSVMVKPLNILFDGDENALDEEDMCDINVQYDVYDTPGQKVLECIPPLYITGAFCVFIVYDITDIYSFERAEYWLNYIEENAKGYDNVILIGNKVDLSESDRYVACENVQKYADEHNVFFLEMSVKTKYNFDVLLSWLNEMSAEKFKRELNMAQNDWLSDKEFEGTNDKIDNEEEKEIEVDYEQKRKSKRKSKKNLVKQSRKKRTIKLDDHDSNSIHSKKRSCC